MAGYLRSMLLQYLEEMLAETIAHVLATEGEAIGTITIGSQFFSVVFFPSNHDADTTANACYIENACR
jgi:hypothetical protein